MKNRDNAIRKLRLEAIKRGYLSEESGRSNWEKIIYRIKIENKKDEDWFFCVSSSDFFENIKQALYFLKNKPLTDEWRELLNINN